MGGHDQEVLTYRAHFNGCKMDDSKDAVHSVLQLVIDLYKTLFSTWATSLSIKYPGNGVVTIENNTEYRN